MQIIENCDLFYKKKDLPELCIGDKAVVTIYLELPKEAGDGEKKEKERTQAYEGVIISKHGNKGQTESTITVRKVSQEVGIEKVFLLNSPWLKSINIIKLSIRGMLSNGSSLLLVNLSTNSPDKNKVITVKIE